MFNIDYYSDQLFKWINVNMWKKVSILFICSSSIVTIEIGRKNLRTCELFAPRATELVDRPPGLSLGCLIILSLSRSCRMPNSLLMLSLVKPKEKLLLLSILVMPFPESVSFTCVKWSILNAPLPKSSPKYYQTFLCLMYVVFKIWRPFFSSL